MDNHRVFRGQEKKYDNFLFVPSALRGYSPKEPLSICGDIPGDIPKVEKLFCDLGLNLNEWKEACNRIPKKALFQDCADALPYLFWLSIIFCEQKIGSGQSFLSGGHIPYVIDMGFDDNGELRPIFTSHCLQEYAMRMVEIYFAHDPPAKKDKFIRDSMEFQQYYRGKENPDKENPDKKNLDEGSSGYLYVRAECYKRSDGICVCGKGLPDHFTCFLDWTEDKNIARHFAKTDGTIVSMDLEKYRHIVGDSYLITYKDEGMLLDTATYQKGIVTFWPWIFTIDELTENELGRALDFRRE